MDQKQYLDDLRVLSENFEKRSQLTDARALYYNALKVIREVPSLIELVEELEKNSVKNSPQIMARIWGNTKDINGFFGDYRFLSNFYEKELIWEGFLAASSEHHYQAAKTMDPEEQALVRAAINPDKSKKAGRKVTITPDWDSRKILVMKSIIKVKFQDPELREMLRATGNVKLEETNHWHDTFWGVCICEKHNGIGENHLGKILEHERNSIQY